MALPLTPLNAQAAFNTLQSKGLSAQRIAGLIDGQATVSAADLQSLLSVINDLVAYAQTVAADTTLTAAVVAYAQSIYPSTTVQADFSASLAAAEALQAAILKDYPLDANRHPLDRTMDAVGNIAYVALAASQLPNTMPAISAWLATVQ